MDREKPRLQFIFILHPWEPHHVLDGYYFIGKKSLWVCLYYMNLTMEFLLLSPLQIEIFSVWMSKTTPYFFVCLFLLTYSWFIMIIYTPTELWSKSPQRGISILSLTSFLKLSEMYIYFCYIISITFLWLKYFKISWKIIKQYKTLVTTK